MSDKRRTRPDIKSMLAVARREVEIVSRSLSVDSEEYIQNPTDINRLASVLGDIAALLRSKPNAPIMRTEEYREIIDTSAFISKADASGKITYVNENFCNTFGYDYDELIGETHRIIHHPETSQKTIEDIWDTISVQKKKWKGEIRNISKGGETFYLNAQVWPQIDQGGHVVGYTTIYYDATDEVKERAFATQQKELNSVILDEQPNMVAVIAENDGIVNLNRAFYETFGFEALHDFKSQHKCIFELFNSADDVCDMHQADWWLKKVSANSSDESIRLKATGVDGNIRTYSVSIKLVSVGDDTLKQGYYIVSFGDITQAQNEADFAREEAIMAHRESFAKSSFLANMSHEIRTPINGITPYLSLLSETNLTQEQSEYINIIQNSAQSLLSIINDILDFSKIETGNFPIEEIDFDPVKELESAVDLYYAKAQEKGIALCAFIDPRIPMCVLGDPLRIKQVLANLIGNAIKFTYRGEVSISIELLKSRKNIARIGISVKDTGVGIKEEDAGNIFSPFTQADNTVSRKFGGTGLGLSICKNLVDKMGGELTFESDYGSGSCFSFELNLKVCNSARNRSREAGNHKTIGVYVTNARQEYCTKTLYRYIDAFKMEYAVVSSKEDTECANCDVLIVVSTGEDVVEWIDAELGAKMRIITILPINVKNRNRFASNASISMPLNGSKIYDAITDNQSKSDLGLEEAIKKAASGTYNAKVLVAEDNKTNQTLAVAMLNRFGIEPVVVNNGWEAVEAVRDLYYSKNEQFDLILMDIHMPVMTGVEATREIVSHEIEFKLKPTTIVALTADAIEGRDEEFLSEGMSGYLSKPIDLLAFDESIARFLMHKHVNDVLVGDVKPTKRKTDTVANTCDEAKEEYARCVSRELDLDIETAAALIQSFYDTWHELSAPMRSAIVADEHLIIKEIAHSLKGAAGSLRLDDIYVLTKEIEECARLNKDVDYLAIFEELKNKIEGEGSI